MIRTQTVLFRCFCWCCFILQQKPINLSMKIYFRFLVYGIYIHWVRLLLLLPLPLCGCVESFEFLVEWFASNQSDSCRITNYDEAPQSRLPIKHTHTHTHTRIHIAGLFPIRFKTLLFSEISLLLLLLLLFTSFCLPFKLIINATEFVRYFRIATTERKEYLAHKTSRFYEKSEFWCIPIVRYIIL